MPSPLVPCPPIGTHTLQRNNATRTLVVDNQVVQFTPTEYRLLLPLLQGKPLSDTELAQAAFSRGIDRLVRESLDKHMDKIRGKLEPLGLSVYRLRRYGYVLSLSPLIDPHPLLSLIPTCQISLVALFLTGEITSRKEGTFPSSFLRGTFVLLL